MLIAVVVSLVIPPIYLAETKILPPQTGGVSMASVFASQLGSIGMPASLGVKTASDLYIGLIRTRPVLDYVIDKLDLMREFKSREVARGVLAENLKIKDDKRSGIITIGFQHRKPQDAANVANAFVEGLQNLNNNLAVTEAAQRRLFFEEQLKTAKENLIASENALKAFQQRTGTIKIDDETKAVMGTVAEMRARISAKEVQLRVMRTYATDDNPDFQRLREEAYALKQELLKIESNNRDEDDATPTVGRLSSLGTEYLRRMREFKYNESLYEILMRQYGVAKLDEARNSAIIQSIEKAEAPENRIKPQRKRIVVNAGAIVFILSVIWVFSRRYYQVVMSKPENLRELEKLQELLDLSRLVKDLKLDKLLPVIRNLFGKR